MSRRHLHSSPSPFWPVLGMARPLRPGAFRGSTKDSRDIRSRFNPDGSQSEVHALSAKSLGTRLDDGKHLLLFARKDKTRAFSPIENRILLHLDSMPRYHQGTFCSKSHSVFSGDREIFTPPLRTPPYRVLRHHITPRLRSNRKSLTSKKLALVLA